nr:C-type lectin member A [Pinctada fucata]
MISADKRTWYSAAAECQSWNAHLAKIDSMDEVLFLRKEIDYTPHVSSTHFWIGGRDSVIWGRFEWTSTGTFVDQGFTNWWPGEPNNEKNVQRCLEIRHCPTYRDTWSDADCHIQHHFICKKSATDTSNTGVTGVTGRPSNLNLQQTIDNHNTESHNVNYGGVNNQNNYNTGDVVFGKK